MKILKKEALPPPLPPFVYLKMAEGIERRFQLGAGGVSNYNIS
jgi:hypothetical protein